MPEKKKEQPRRQYPTSADKSALRAYNAGQPLRSDGERLPYQEPPAVKGPPSSVQDLFNQGRFNMNTQNGVLSSRGGAAGGGMGSGSGGGGGEDPLGPSDLFAAGLGLAPSRPPGGFVDHGDGSKTYTAPPRPAAAPGPRTASDIFAAQLRAPGEMGSSGTLTMRAREQSMHELNTMLPDDVPPLLRQTAQQQILAGDYGAPGRAAMAWQAVPPELRARAQRDPIIAQNLQQSLANHVLAGGQGVRDKKAEDAQRYHEAAQRNTAKAKVNASEAFKLGLDALAGESQIVAEQRRRNQLAYPSADLATLQKLAAAGDVDAARAIEGQPGPWAPGSPQFGVRRNTQDASRQVLDEAHARALELGNQRYVVPKEIQADADQKVAQYAAQGRVDAATINAASRAPGSSQHAAALRAWGVQMGERQKLFQPTVPFPQWAKENGIQIPASPDPLGVSPVVSAPNQASDPVVAHIATDPEYYQWYMSNPNGAEQKKFYEEQKAGMR